MNQETQSNLLTPFYNMRDQYNQKLLTIYEQLNQEGQQYQDSHEVLVNYLKQFQSQDKQLDDSYKAIDLNYLFPNRIWNFELTQNFIKKIDINNSVITIMLMSQLLQGKFNEENKELLIQMQSLYCGSLKLPFQYAFAGCLVAHNSQFIIILILPEKQNIINSQGQLEGIKFIHKMIFVDMIFENYGFYSQKMNKCQQILEEYLHQFLKIDSVLQDIHMIKEKRNPYQQSNKIKIGMKTKNKNLLIQPRSFEIIKLNSQNYVFDSYSKSWMTKKLYDSIQTKIIQINLQRSNYQLIKKYICLPSSQQINNLIQKLPKFKNKITELQLQAIAWKGDTLILGRSGTGKTTCAILKLFILNSLFNLRQDLKIQNWKRIQIQRDKKNINEMQNQQNLFEKQKNIFKDKLQLKTIFITASPLLAWQIKQNYQQMTDNFEVLVKEQFIKNKYNINESNIIQEESIFEIINEIQEQKIQENNPDSDDDQFDDYEKKMGRFTKLSEITQYPAFLTLRKLIFSIDASLINPFFEFSLKSHTSAQWHNEQIGVVTLNQQGQQRNEILIQKIQDYDDKEFIVCNNTQEVTFDLFFNSLWPKIIKKIEHSNQNIKKLDPALVWYEIVTKIKGNATSFQYPNKYMNFDNYSYYHKVLSDEYTKLLYKAFEQYEIIKHNLGYYDLLDVVNHINHELKYGNDVLEKVHYLILDELQDIPSAVFILLNQIADFGLICCGDNAQNIQKGTGQQFIEFRNHLNQSGMKSQYRDNQVQTFIMSLNFRFHDQILLLTNSVIRMIELLFPYKIDIFDKEERSYLQGPKPIVIQSDDEQVLLNYLKKNYNIESNFISFGSQQVIIVRDQQSKPKVPNSLQQTLILTIYEAKGLEFDDIILFNFFTDSDCTIDDWNILKNFQIKDTFIKMKQNISQYVSHEFYETIEMKKLFLKQSTKQQNLSDNIDKFVNYQTLCQELKLLYVALTRAKNKIIIYDQDFTKRKCIQKLWDDLQIIQIIYSIELDYIQEHEIIFSKQYDNKNNWRSQGLNFFRINNYEQAKKCFQFANDIQLEKKAQAYQLATQAAIQDNGETLFLQAALIFEDLNIINRAAQCYFSAKKYNQAYRLYKQLNAKLELAEAAYFCGKYEEAGQLFFEMQDYRRSIESYTFQGNYQNVIKLIIEQKNHFSKEEYDLYLNKYLPIILQQILDEIDLKYDDLTNQIDDQSESFQVCHSELSSSFQKSDFQSQILNLNQKLKSRKLSNLSDSFEKIDGDQFDHISFYDPDDQWIQKDQIQLLQSITSIDFSSQNEQNIMQLNQDKSLNIINQQNKKIFLDETTFTKIVQLFSQVSDEFNIHIQKKLESFQDYSTLINNIQIDTLSLILSTLEQFQNYKLCIYICNQFNLLQKLGIYFTTLASKYTPLQQNSIIADNQMIQNSLKRKHLLDKAQIAHQAIQNILSVINSSILQFKYEEQLDYNNSFGILCYQDLISLGFWKQVIFQLNYQNSKDLCLSFNNHKDLISIIQLIYEKRQDNQLTQDEKIQLIKSQYLLQIEQYFILKTTKLLQIDSIFLITNSISQGNVIDSQKINQILNNINFKAKDLNVQEQLRQFESIVLSYLLCCNYIISEDATLEQKILLINIQYYCLSQIKSRVQNQNIMEVMQFLYKFSFPKGQIMNRFQQYVILNIQSKLLKNIKNIKNEKVIFVDSSFEYLLIHFETLLFYFKNYFSKSILEELKIFDQQDHEYQYSNTLTQLVKSIKHQQLQSVYQYLIQQSIKIPQISTNQKQRVPEDNNSVDLENQNLLQIINQDQKRFFFEYLQKTNKRIPNLSSLIQTTLTIESVDLFKQAFKNQDEVKHAQLILGINLCNFSNNLPLAIYTVSSIENKHQKEKYMKYIEFLECQNYNIIEDMIDCFLDYYYFWEQNLHVDEWNDHLIRIGLKLLLSQEFISTIIIPDYFLDYLDLDDFQNCIVIQNCYFPIKNQQVMIEYFNCLFDFIQSCNSNYYEQNGYLLLVVFVLNLFTISKELQDIIQNILAPSNVNNQLKNIISILNLSIQLRRAKLISDSNNITITCFLEEKFINLEVIQKKESENQNISIYQSCLDNWNLHLQQAEQIRLYGFKIFKAYRESSQFIRKQSDYQIRYDPKVIRYFQFYQLDFSFLKEILNNQSWKNQLLHCYKLQEDFLKAKQLTHLTKDLQQISQNFEQISKLLLELMEGHQIQDKLINIENFLKAHQESIQKEQTLQQSVLERNREMLKLKWQNLQAGIKVQKKLVNISNKNCVRIQELNEEECQI